MSFQGVVDPPKTIEVALDQGGRWTTANHTGSVAAGSMLGTVTLNEVKPEIIIIYDLKQMLEGAMNHIYILQRTFINDFSQYGRRSRFDQNIRLDVIVRTGTRPDLLAKRQEAKRILQTLRTTIGDMGMPSGYLNCFNQLWIHGEKDKSDTMKNFNMIVLDVELRSIGIPQANA